MHAFLIPLIILCKGLGFSFSSVVFTHIGVDMCTRIVIYGVDIAKSSSTAKMQRKRAHHWLILMISKVALWPAVITCLYLACWIATHLTCRNSRCSWIGWGCQSNARIFITHTLITVLMQSTWILIKVLAKAVLDQPMVPISFAIFLAPGLNWIRQLIWTPATFRSRQSQAKRVPG